MKSKAHQDAKRTMLQLMGLHAASIQTGNKIKEGAAKLHDHHTKRADKLRPLCSVPRSDDLGAEYLESLDSRDTASKYL